MHKKMLKFTSRSHNNLQPSVRTEGNSHYSPYRQMRVLIPSDLKADRHHETSHLPSCESTIIITYYKHVTTYKLIALKSHILVINLTPITIGTTQLSTKSTTKPSSYIN